MRTFEDVVGGREALRSALADASADDSKCGVLVKLLADPMRIGDALGTLVADAGMTIGQVIEMFRHATQARALVRATTVMSEHLPAIVEDAAMKAQDWLIECEQCRGSGRIVVEDEERMCPPCRGQGKVVREADFQRQKLFFEASGLIKRGDGARVTLQQAIGLTPTPAFFSKFVSATDDVAYDIVESEKTL